MTNPKYVPPLLGVVLPAFGALAGALLHGSDAAVIGAGLMAAVWMYAFCRPRRT